MKPLVKPVASGTELVVHQETIASVAETIVPIAESTAPVADTIPPREETIALADAIDHPAHYHVGTYEAINVIEAWDLGFHLGNVVKYVARAGHKGSRTDDLRKARWYLERAIAQEEQRAL